MGRQLAFWKYDDGVYLDNSKVYETVCIEGTTIKGLSNLPISDILKKVKDTFSNYNQLDEFNYENSDAAFSIETTEQSIMFDCSWSMDSDDLNAIIDIMDEFKCPFYDPQIETRFDEYEN